MTKDKFKQFLKRKIIMKGQAGFKVMTYRFAFSPLGVNNYKKKTVLNIIVYFIGEYATIWWCPIPPQRGLCSDNWTNMCTLIIDFSKNSSVYISLIYCKALDFVVCVVELYARVFLILCMVTGVKRCISFVSLKAWYSSKYLQFSLRVFQFFKWANQV